jgi:signal transduction histidine kinase
MTRHLQTALGWIAVALLAVLAYTLAANGDAGPPPQRFEAAELCVQHTTEQRYAREGFGAVFAAEAQLRPSCWAPVSLPQHIHPDQPSLQGASPELFQAWFRLHYTPPPGMPAGEAVLIYVPRVMGAAWQVRVDGAQVANNLDDWRMTWNKPLAIRLDPSRARAGQPLDIRIGVIRRSQYGASMSPITVGPATAVTPHLAWRTMLQTTMPAASTVVLLLMGGFFFAFWLARRSEGIHLLLALASVAWCVCNLQYVMHRPDDATLANWYASIVNMAICWVMWLLYRFVLRIDEGPRVRWLESALPWYVLFMSAIAIPIWPFTDDVGVLYQLANAAVGVGVTVVITRQAWRRDGLLEVRVISTALTLSLAAGAHDVALLAQLITPESIYLLPYGTLLLFASLLFAVQRRYVAALAETEHLSSSLAERLAVREAELRAQHTRLLSIERDQALLLERQRLMRDMHDGLGSALMSSLVLVEQGQLPNHDVAVMLRECVDDLRLVIDSLEPIEHDLGALLATLRYRLGKRLEHAGLSLEWGVRDLPPLPWLNPSQALHVLRILQETLTNVLKHASASRVRILTRVDEPAGQPRRVCVCIEDNGLGFDIDSAKAGRGLRHLRQRARGLHGEVDIDSQPGQGTRVSLYLPVDVTPDSAPQLTPALSS